MATGETSSRGFALSGDPGLAEAQGKLREALAALQNLSRLLTSIRVAPRALSPLLPGAAEVTLQAGGAFRRMLERVELGLTRDHGAAQALGDYVEPRLDALVQALHQAGAAPVNARRRLELERSVVRVEPELSAATRLLDLLADALWAPRSALRIRGLLGEVSAGEERGGVIPVSVRGAVDLVEINAPSSVATGLFSLAINLSAPNNRAEGVTLTLEELGRGFRARVDPAAIGERRLLVPQALLIAPTRAALGVAAEQVGCSIEPTPRGRGLCIQWGTSP